MDAHISKVIYLIIKSTEHAILSICRLRGYSNLSANKIIYCCSISARIQSDVLFVEPDDFHEVPFDGFLPCDGLPFGAVAHVEPDVAVHIQVDSLNIHSGLTVSNTRIVVVSFSLGQPFFLRFWPA